MRFVLLLIAAAPAWCAALAQTPQEHDAHAAASAPAAAVKKVQAKPKTTTARPRPVAAAGCPGMSVDQRQQMHDQMHQAGGMHGQMAGMHAQMHQPGGMHEQMHGKGGHAADCGAAPRP